MFEKLWVNTSNSSQLHLFSLGSWGFTTTCSCKNICIFTVIVLRETEQSHFKPNGTSKWKLTCRKFGLVVILIIRATDDFFSVADAKF